MQGGEQLAVIPVTLDCMSSNNGNKALSYALMGIGTLAALMVAFYYFQHRFSRSENEVEFREVQESVSEIAEFVGTYSPEWTPLQPAGKRISSFTVNRKEDGGYLGVAKVDTIGGEEGFIFQCVDVRIESADFALNCQHIARAPSR